MFQAILENLVQAASQKEDAFEISKRSYAAPARRGQARCSQPLTLHSPPKTTKTDTKVHQVTTLEDRHALKERKDKILELDFTPRPTGPTTRIGWTSACSE